jgi:hypothetical protein
MAKLPKIDAEAIWIRDLLNKGKGHREAAKARADAAVARGNAGEETKKLAADLGNTKRGRQPYGAKHRWVEIGQDNEEMLEAGLSDQERFAEISKKYHLNDESEIKTAIAKYRRAIEIARADREKYSDPI